MIITESNLVDNRVQLENKSLFTTVFSVIMFANYCQQNRINFL